MKYIKWIVPGLLLAFVVLPFLRVGGDYPGLAWDEVRYDEFVGYVEGEILYTDIWSRFSFHILGTQIRPQFILNAVGCFLLALVAGKCEPFAANFKKMKVAALVAAVLCLALPFLPYLLKAKMLFFATYICFITQAVAKIVLLRALAAGMQKQVDDYVYMEVGKDLRFGAETFGFFFVAEVITSFLMSFSWFEIMWYIYLIGEMAAVVYVCVRLIHYTKKLNLLATNN
ncbi:MAG: hypothetical protein E7269_06685 [Lachnospiraceae bacterium]|nr:hypothetical protein [Lachnospiraceae bacterium]